MVHLHRLIATSVFILTFLTACGGGAGSDDAAADNPPRNSLPIAVIEMNTVNGYSPLVVEFNGNSSSDPDGGIATYTWETGDGNSYTGSTISHTYLALGSFSATLTVTDTDGASASSSVSINVHAQAAGPYFGDICSSVTGECFYAYGIVGSDSRVFLDGYDYGVGEWNRLFGGSVNISSNLLSGDILAEIFEPEVFLDGSNKGDVTVDALVEPLSGISGSFSGVGDNGIAELTYNSPIDIPASLAKVAGTWSWSDGFGYTDTMVVDADGSFVSSDTDGCNTVGQFTLLDTRRNEYDIEYELTCPPGLYESGNGTRKGMALIDDYYESDDWLYWFITFQEGPMVGQRGGGELSRPRDLASTVVGKQEASSHITEKPRFMK